MSGAFGNLYDQSIGAQCHEIRIQAIYDESASASSSRSSSEAMASSTMSSALSGSTSIISASETSGLTSESRTMTGSGFSTATPFSNSATATGSDSADATSTGDAAAPPAEGEAALRAGAHFHGSFCHVWRVHGLPRRCFGALERSIIPFSFFGACSSLAHCMLGVARPPCLYLLAWYCIFLYYPFRLALASI